MIKFKKYRMGGGTPQGGTPSTKPPLVKGPRYIQADPRRTEEENLIRQRSNFYDALRFRNGLQGANNNMTRVATSSEDPIGTRSVGLAGTRAGYAGTLAEVDPMAIERADSVINTMRPMLPRIEGLMRRNATMQPVRRFGGKHLQFGGTYTPQTGEIGSEQQANSLVGAVGAINPIIGAGLKIGQAIGKASRDEDGLYKSKAGEFFSNSLDPTTGIQNLKDLRKNFTGSTVANQLTLGLVGKSATQMRLEKEKEWREQEALRTRIADSDSRLLTRNYDFRGGRTAGSIYAMGGKLKPLNSDTVEVEGPKHEQGGVKVFGAELEGEETVANDFVFSDYLGFADRHKKIAKQIGAIEKKPINNERFATLELLRKKEQALKQEQEGLKDALGIPADAPESLTQMMMGGKLKKRKC